MTVNEKSERPQAEILVRAGSEWQRACGTKLRVCQQRCGRNVSLPTSTEHGGHIASKLRAGSRPNKGSVLQCIGLCYSICRSEHTPRRRTNARVKIFELPACEKSLTKPRGAGARDGTSQSVGRTGREGTRATLGMRVATGGGHGRSTLQCHSGYTCPFSRAPGASRPRNRPTLAAGRRAVANEEQPCGQNAKAMRQRLVVADLGAGIHEP